MVYAFNQMRKKNSLWEEKKAFSSEECPSQHIKHRMEECFMAEFERLSALEGAMNMAGSQEEQRFLTMMAMASLGRFGGEIILGGMINNNAFFPADAEGYFPLFTSEEEFQKAELCGYVVDIRMILQIVREHAEDVKGVVLNPENQRVFLDQDMVEEMLDLIGDDPIPDEDSKDEDPAEEEASAEEEEGSPMLDTIVTSETPGWEWLPIGARLAVAAGTELNEEAKNTFAHAWYYANEKNPFALLGDHVVKFLDPNALEEDTPEEVLAALREEAEDAMAESLSAMPDFSKYTMDDGMLAVQLFSGVWCFHDREDFDDPMDSSGEPSLGTALFMRGELLTACEKGRILAFFMPEAE